jgi:hypothetical protein
MSRKASRTRVVPWSIVSDVFHPLLDVLLNFAFSRQFDGVRFQPEGQLSGDLVIARPLN